MREKSRYSTWARMKRSKISYLYIAPYMILFFTFTVLPVVIAMFLSFTSFNVLEMPKFVGFDNYTRLFLKDSVFIKGVKNTIVLALFIGPGGYIMSLISAWFINELTPKVRALLTLVFYAPSISGNAYLIWSVAFSGDDYGYINSLLTRLGYITEPIQFFQNTDYIIPLIVLISLWNSFGTGFLSMIAAFQGVDRTYYEAGALDGIKNRWQELWFITMPMMKPQMMFSAVMSITGAFNVGAIVTAFCGFPSTDYAAHTIMNHLEDYGSTRFEMGYASAIAVFLFVMMVGANSLFKKFLNSVGK
ncbi:MAG: sugar ABC transporter permease [Clostridia bacterium]|nr:sugar ABC transporter permease [Clostridia bacterium]